MRVKTQMTKLKAGEAKYISLVRRAANQIPFRIQKADKGDTDMAIQNRLNLATIFKGAKADKVTPHVSAVVLKMCKDKPKKMEKMKDAVKKAGFDVSTEVVDEEKGTILFKQADYEEKDLVGRVSENLLVVTKSYEPWCANITTFAERLGADGYYDALVSGSWALHRLVSDLVYKAETHEQMVAVVSKAVDDFASYAKNVAATIPSSVYSLDNELAGILKADDEEEAPVASTDNKENTQKGANEIAASPVANASPSGSVTGGEGVPGADGKGSNSVGASPTSNETTGSTTGGLGVPGASGTGAASIGSSPVASAAPGASTLAGDVTAKFEKTLADILTAVTGLTSTVQTLATTQKAQETALASVTSELASVKKSAEETSQKLVSTVNAPPVVEDHPSGNLVRKSEEDEYGPQGDGYWDSAFAPKKK